MLEIWEKFNCSKKIYWKSNFMSIKIEIIRGRWERMVDRGEARDSNNSYSFHIYCGKSESSKEIDNHYIYVSSNICWQSSVWILPTRFKLTTQHRTQVEEFELKETKATCCKIEWTMGTAVIRFAWRCFSQFVA